MRNRWMEAAAWCGPAGLLCFGIGIGPLMANMLPPPSPEMTAQAVADMYSANLSGIRGGAIFMIFAGALLVAFAGAISAQMRAIEGDRPVLTYIQLAAGALGTTPFFLGALIMGAAAFRPERSPEIIQFVNDLAWIYYVMPAGNAIAQLLPIGFVVLSDTSSRPAFPRWVGYLNIWVALSFLPPSFLLFFKTGPFAWNGLLSFWLGAATFSIWTGVMCWALIRSSRDQGVTTDKAV